MKSPKFSSIGSIIIYVGYQYQAEEVAKYLLDQKSDERFQKVAAFHAGMKTSVKDALVAGFLKNEIPIMVSTIAFGTFFSPLPQEFTKVTTIFIWLKTQFFVITLD